ncbi:MAG: arginine deiminase [Eubacteriales bacterium]|nr:arginine deiminase [Eubacteriales bacterium]
MNSPIRVNSEVGKLKRVLLHRPGQELENLMPQYLSRQLFEDIPYLVHAREEHDEFARTLRACGVEVCYLLDLVAEAVLFSGERERLVDDFLSEIGISARGAEQPVREYLLGMPAPQMLNCMARGVRKSDLGRREPKHLVDFIDDAYPFLADPMPNLYFTRDPFFMVGTGVCMSSMANAVRARETLFGQYLFSKHPVYRDTPLLHQRSDPFSVEGGDVLVLSGEAVAIGISQRTAPQAVEALAERLIGEGTGIERVLAIDIPKTRSYMHLDTIMTMVDRDKFTIHASILPVIRTFSLTRKRGKLAIEPGKRGLAEALANALQLDHVALIQCGGNSIIDAAREQWNDGTNTLAVAPGEVIAFSRNHVTNGILRDNGILVHEIPSAELSRGRGGPRCMSMPLWRDETELLNRITDEHATLAGRNGTAKSDNR